MINLYEMLYKLDESTFINKTRRSIFSKQGETIIKDQKQKIKTFISKTRRHIFQEKPVSTENNTETHTTINGMNVKKGFDFSKLGDLKSIKKKQLTNAGQTILKMATPELVKHESILKVIMSTLHITKPKGFILSKDPKTGYDQLTCRFKPSSNCVENFRNILINNNYIKIKVPYKTYLDLMYNKINIQDYINNIYYVSDVLQDIAAETDAERKKQLQIRYNQRYKEMEEQINEIINEFNDSYNKLSNDLKNYIDNIIYAIYSNDVYISPDEGLIFYTLTHSRKTIFTFTGLTNYNLKTLYNEDDAKKIEADTRKNNRYMLFLNRQIKQTIQVNIQTQFLHRLCSTSSAYTNEFIDGYPVYRIFCRWINNNNAPSCRSYLNRLTWNKIKLISNNGDYGCEYISNDGKLYINVYNISKYPDIEKYYNDLNDSVSNTSPYKYKTYSRNILTAMIEVGLTDNAKKEMDNKYKNKK